MSGFQKRSGSVDLEVEPDELSRVELTAPEGALAAPMDPALEAGIPAALSSTPVPAAVSAAAIPAAAPAVTRSSSAAVSHAAEPVSSAAHVPGEAPAAPSAPRRVNEGTTAPVSRMTPGAPSAPGSTQPPVPGSPPLEGSPSPVAALSRGLRGRIAGALVVVAIYAGLAVAGWRDWAPAEGGRSIALLFRITSQVIDTLRVQEALLYAVAFAPLVVAIGALIRGLAPDTWKSMTEWQTISIVGIVSLLGFGSLTSERLDALVDFSGWVFFVAVVPPVLLVYQVLVSWRQRPRSIGKLAFDIPGLTEPSHELTRFNETHAQLMRAFGIKAAAETGRPVDDTSRMLFMASHYLVPVILLLVVGFASLTLAVEHANIAALCERMLPNPSEAGDYVRRGVQWGLGGAYVTILIEFGRRTFRHDLTVGAATWAVVTLIVGPGLAVLLALAWKMGASESVWQTGLVLFFAGLAPRQVVALIQNVAPRLLRADISVVAPPKAIALTSLRGITPEIAGRLAEEGIGDASTLAYADPIKLVRNLPYDLRQVVDWMDQALLATTLPKHYDLVSERGVTGAIDLAWRWVQSCVKDGKLVLDSTGTTEAFKSLAAGNEADQELLHETARQLFYEEQVCLLWVMYSCFSTTPIEASDAAA